MKGDPNAGRMIGETVKIALAGAFKKEESEEK
jgi:hypothetical protein